MVKKEQRRRRCALCKEPMYKYEKIMSQAFPVHRECAIRMLAGKAQHIERLCNCYVEDAVDLEPKGVTFRESALLAERSYDRLYHKRIIQ